MLFFPSGDYENRLSAVAAAGAAFLLTTGKLTLTAAGNVRITLENPGGSQRRIVVTEVRVLNSLANPVFADVFFNPDAGLPAGATRIQNLYISTGNDKGSSVVIGRADTNLVTPISGGTVILNVGVPEDGEYLLKGQPLFLEPGVKVGINISFTGAADTALQVTFYEEAF